MGLSLAAVSLRAQDDVGAGVARFAGDDRVVVDYVGDELLAGLSDDERALLRRTAILGPLTGPLCDAALRVKGSARALHDLSRANLLIAPVDRAEEEYRMHPLLSGALALELRRDEPELVDGIHRRAGAWHERHGALDRAAEHVTAAGDAEHAAALLWRLAPECIASGRAADLERWLARFTEADLVEHPALSVCAGMHHVAHGDRDAAERWADVAAHALEARDEPDAAPSWAASPSFAPRSRATAWRRWRRTPPVRTRCSSTTADGARSPACSRASPCSCRVTRSMRWSVSTRGSTAAPSAFPRSRRCASRSSGSSALEREDWVQGAELAGSASGVVEEAGLDGTAASALVLAVSAFAAAHGGRVEQARDDARAARRMLATLSDAVPWFAAEARIALARAELRLSDAAAARQLLGEATRLLRPVPEAVVLHAAIDDAWERADTFAAGAVSGPTSLTTAELRVLRFLPSHLPFREIAERLHVSANTVKSQAHAVYRKLDASSRSEAVARAREVGLVDS